MEELGTWCWTYRGSSTPCWAYWRITIPPWASKRINIPSWAFRRLTIPHGETGRIGAPRWGLGRPWLLWRGVMMMETLHWSLRRLGLLAGGVMMVDTQHWSWGRLHSPHGGFRSRRIRWFLTSHWSWGAWEFYEWILEGKLLLEGSLGSTCFPLTIIFPKFLQVQFNLGVHTLRWLWGVIIEHVIRSSNCRKPKSLPLVLIQEHGAPTTYPLPPSSMEHIEVAFRYHVLQLIVSKEAWENGCCDLLWLLEGKPL